MQIVDSTHRLRCIANDQVAFLQPGFLSRTIAFHRYDKNTVLNRKSMEAHDAPMQRDILASHSNVTTSDLPVTDQPARNKLEFPGFSAASV
jgi:hypothetical protein